MTLGDENWKGEWFRTEPFGELVETGEGRALPI